MSRFVQIGGLIFKLLYLEIGVRLCDGKAGHGGRGEEGRPDPILKRDISSNGKNRYQRLQIERLESRVEQNNFHHDVDHS